MFVNSSNLVFSNGTALSMETLDAVAELLVQGQAANTVRTYQSALRYWLGWYEARYQRPFPLALSPAAPLDVEVVVQFIVDHVERTTDDGLRCELPEAVDQQLLDKGWKRDLGAPKLNTTLLRLTVLSKAHRLKQLSNPLEDARVRELIKRVRRGYAARGERPRKKQAVAKDLLQPMLSTCDDSLIGVRDRALLLFAWASGGRRRSEVAAASMENLERIPDVLHEDGRREVRFIYRLTVSKTNQDGQSDPNEAKPIIGVAGEALHAWLKAANITSGKIFRSVRGGKIGKSLSSHSVALIVKARANAAGLEGDFSGHSLRSGFVTEAGRQGKPLAEVMRMSGHRSVPQALAYYQAGDVLASSVASLLDDSTSEVRTS